MAILSQQFSHKTDFHIARRAVELAPFHIFVDSAWPRAALEFDSLNACHHVLNAVAGVPDCVTSNELVHIPTERQAVRHFDRALCVEIWNQCWRAQDCRLYGRAEGVPTASDAFKLACPRGVYLKLSETNIPLG